jgi:predicted DNA-binding transcriptional regulator AlpA
MTHPRTDSIAYPPRGMSRDESARYIGVGPTLFDELVRDGRMPKPKRINSRRVLWDRLRLDAAFSDLPEEKTINPLDRAFGFATE